MIAPLLFSIIISYCYSLSQYCYDLRQISSSSTLLPNHCSALTQDLQISHNTVDAESVGIELSGSASLYYDFTYSTASKYIFSAWIYFHTSSGSQIIYSLTTQTVSMGQYEPQLILTRTASNLETTCSGSAAKASVGAPADDTWRMVVLVLDNTDLILVSQGANSQIATSTEQRCAMGSQLKLSVGKFRQCKGTKLSSTNMGSNTLEGYIRELRIIQDYTDTYQATISQLKQNNAIVTSPPTTSYTLSDLYAQSGTTAALGLKAGSASISTTGAQNFIANFDKAQVTSRPLTTHVTFLFQFSFSSLTDFFPLKSQGLTDNLTLELFGMSGIGETMKIRTNSGSSLDIQLTQTIISSTVYTFAVQFRNTAANTYKVTVWLQGTLQGTGSITLNQPLTALQTQQIFIALPGKGYFAVFVPFLLDENFRTLLTSTSCPRGSQVKSTYFCQDCQAIGQAYQPETNSCVASCQTSTFIDTGNNECTICTSNCQTCASLTTCGTCASSYFKSQDESCLTSCPSGQAPDNSNACQTCLTLSKVYQPQTDSCQSSCSSSTYINPSNNNCESCDQHCSQCSSLSTCSACTTPYLVNSDHICSLTCNIGYTANSNNVCELLPAEASFDSTSVSANNEVILIFSQRIYLINSSYLLSQNPYKLANSILSISLSGNKDYQFSYQIFAEDYDSAHSFKSLKIQVLIQEAISAYDNANVQIVLHPSILLIVAGSIKQTTVSLTLNPQYSQNALVDQKAMETGAQAAAIMTQSIMGSNIILSLIMDFSLKFLWSSLNTAQLVQFFPLLCEPMPINTRTVFLELSFANGDFQFLASLKQSIRDVFGIKADQISGQNALDLCFQNNDFESTSFFLNVESKLYLIFFYCFIVVPLLLILYLFCLCLKCKKVAKCCQGYLALNTFLRGFVELFLELYISSLVGFYDTTFDNSSDSVSSAFGIICFIFCVLFVLLTLLLILKSLARKQTRSSLFLEDIKLEDKKCMRSLYYPFFLLQRILYSMILVLLRTYTYVQLGFLIFIFTAMLAYMIAVKPFESKVQNFLVCLESVSFIVTCFILLGLTITKDEISDSLKQILGFVIVGVVCCCLMIGIGVALVEMCKEIRKKCKKKKRSVLNDTSIATEFNRTDIRSKFKEETHDFDISEIDKTDTKKKATDTVMMFKKIRVGKRTKLPHGQ